MSVLKKVTLALVVMSAFFSGSVRSLMIASAQATSQPDRSCGEGHGGSCS